MDTLRTRIIIIAAAFLSVVLFLGIYWIATPLRHQADADRRVEGVTRILERTDRALPLTRGAADILALAREWETVSVGAETLERSSAKVRSNYESLRDSVGQNIQSRSLSILRASDKLTLLDRMTAAEAFYIVRRPLDGSTPPEEVGHQLLRTLEIGLAPPADPIALSSAQRLLTAMTGKIDVELASAHKQILADVAQRSARMQSLKSRSDFAHTHLQRARRTYVERAQDVVRTSGMNGQVSVAGDHAEILNIRGSQEVERLFQQPLVQQQLVDLGFVAMQLPSDASALKFDERLSRLLAEVADTSSLEE